MQHKLQTNPQREEGSHAECDTEERETADAVKERNSVP